jgi:hypothetical protein
MIPKKKPVQTCDIKSCPNGVFVGKSVQKLKKVTK